MAGGWKTDYARYRGYFQNAITAAQKKQDLKMFLEILLTLSTIIIFISLALRPTLITISELVRDIDSKEEETYTLVSEPEADFASGKISVTSPVGKASW